jgi:hypothetical protein
MYDIDYDTEKKGGIEFKRGKRAFVIGPRASSPRKEENRLCGSIVRDRGS